MTMLGAAIFDMDGLLADTEPTWRQVEVEVFARHGVHLTEEQCLATKGMFVDDVARFWFAHHPWEGPSPEDVASEIVDAMAVRLSRQVEFKDGAPHALDLCHRRGLRLALASSSPRRLIDAVMGRLQTAGRFAVVHSAQDEKAGKPHPAVFLSTARLLGETPARCVVFEDAPAGVVAAKAAGMLCVAVPESGGIGLGPRRPRDEDAPAGWAQADVVLGSLSELDGEVLDRLGRAARDLAQRAPPP
jgi:sugar-phosphatase